MSGPPLPARSISAAERNSALRTGTKRVATSTFIITPYNVDIMGDLLDELENNGVFF